MTQDFRVISAIFTAFLDHTFGGKTHWTRKSYFCRVCEALMPADSLEWPPLTASCLRV